MALAFSTSQNRHPPPISQNSFSASHFTSSPSQFFFINPPPSFHKTFQNQVGEVWCYFCLADLLHSNYLPLRFLFTFPANLGVTGGGRRRTVVGKRWGFVLLCLFLSYVPFQVNFSFFFPPWVLIFVLLC